MGSLSTTFYQYWCNIGSLNIEFLQDDNIRIYKLDFNNIITSAVNIVFIKVLGFVVST